MASAGFRTARIGGRVNAAQHGRVHDRVKIAAPTILFYIGTSIIKFIVQISFHCINTSIKHINSIGNLPRGMPY